MDLGEGAAGAIDRRVDQESVGSSSGERLGSAIGAAPEALVSQMHQDQHCGGGLRGQNRPMVSESSASAMQQQSAAVARVRINMSWLLKLRRAAVIGQLATIAFVHSGLGVPLRLLPLLGIVMLGMTANLALQSWFLAHRADAKPKAWLGTGRTLLGWSTRDRGSFGSPRGSTRSRS